MGVGEVTSHGLYDRGSIPGKAEQFIFIAATRPALGCPHSSVPVRTRSNFFGIKRPQSEAGYSPPSSA
jgi:hypothetical protein